MLHPIRLEHFVFAVSDDLLLLEVSPVEVRHRQEWNNLNDYIAGKVQAIEEVEIFTVSLDKLAVVIVFCQQQI